MYGSAFFSVRLWEDHPLLPELIQFFREFGPLPSDRCWIWLSPSLIKNWIGNVKFSHLIAILDSEVTLNYYKKFTHDEMSAMIKIAYKDSEYIQLFDAIEHGGDAIFLSVGGLRDAAIFGKVVPHTNGNEVYFGELLAMVLETTKVMQNHYTSHL